MTLTQVDLHAVPHAPTGATYSPSAVSPVGSTGSVNRTCSSRPAAAASCWRIAMACDRRSIDAGRPRRPPRCRSRCGSARRRGSPTGTPRSGSFTSVIDLGQLLPAGPAERHRHVAAERATAVAGDASPVEVGRRSTARTRRTRPTPAVPAGRR